MADAQTSATAGATVEPVGSVTRHRWLRSVQGQLTLLAGVLAGAVVLAVATVCLREVVFERTVYQRLPEVPAEVADAVTAFARDEAATQPAVREGETELVYVVWLTDDTSSEQPDRVARYLASEPLAKQTLGWVRRTLATGNPSQRQRALSLLGYFADSPEHARTALTLARRERERAKQRGEAELVETAQTVVERLESIVAE